jgi:hypothetical protein
LQKNAGVSLDQPLVFHLKKPCCVDKASMVLVFSPSQLCGGWRGTTFCFKKE